MDVLFFPFFLINFRNYEILFQCYMRALFDYYPDTDSLLPCPDIGLQFEKGDILEVSYFIIKAKVLN